MTFLADPAPHNENKFIIYHNGTPYNVDSIKMAESSHFFRENLFKFKKQSFSINDRHSESAFSTFINLCSFKATNISADDKIELLSLFDEWECLDLKKYFLDTYSNSIITGKTEKPNVNETIAKQENVEKQTNEIEKQTNDLEKNQESQKIHSFDPNPKENTEIDNGKSETQKDTKEDIKINSEKMKNDEIKSEISKESKKGSFKVHIKTRTGSLYSIILSGENTIGEFKKLIKEKTGIDPERQILFFNTQRIDENDEKTVESFGIKKKSKIYVEKTDETDKGDEIILFVHDFNSPEEQIPFYISLSKTGKDLKLMIQNKLQLPPISELYELTDGVLKLIKDNSLLRDCGVSYQKNIIAFDKPKK